MKEVSTATAEQASLTALLIQENERLRHEKQQLEAVVLQQQTALAESERRWKSVLEADADMVQQRQVHEVLRTNAYRLSNLIASLQEGILLEDEHRTIVLVNQLFCDLFAIPATPVQMKGMNCLGMAEQSKGFFKHPDQFVARVDQLLADQKLVTGEELELADGRIFERDYVPIFMDDVYAGHLWKYSDITKRKIAENASVRLKEKYQRIIENMNLGLIEVDLEERIVYTNHSFCAMSGYEPDDLLGRVATEILLKGQNIDFMRDKNESRLRGSMDTYEVAIKNKRGEAMWWLVSGAPLYSETGEVIGSTGIHLDITNQKQLESELRVAKQEAERSSHAKELFLANMSHEIRTPMNAILSLGQQLTKTTLTDHQQFFLGMINTAARNLLVIINDILDFSKIEAGQLSLEHIGFNMTDLLQRAVHVMSENARQKDLQLSMQVAPDLAPVLMGDPYRLTQILLNLLGNSIKFTEKGSVQVRCNVRAVGNCQLVTLSINDTGIGMDATFKENLFSKFTQEDASIGRRYGGTGLGMSITKQLVDLMGGTIEVDSTKNKGTTIKVHLSFPVGDEENSPVATKQSCQDTGILGGKRVLVVEDNDMNRLVATTILASYGVIVLEAADGLKALEILRTDPIDLVLMDVQMPIMDGLEATRIIRQEISDSIPILALTASAIRTEKEECYKAGMNDFLAKPFEEEELVDKLIKWVNAPETTVEIGFKPLYDLSKLETIGRGNQAFVQKMVRLFCTDAPDVAAQLKVAYHTQDYERVTYLAHQVKPSIDNMGLHAQKEVIREIEQLAVSEPTSVELALLIDQFERAVLGVVEHLRVTYLTEV
ncbi:hybrid sensor histidine kinase/response regulator [Fibrella aquatica]|uniref:hybrid sensor histidine kinase/response regulator n=1 Tax=Fibrella aquatica TaxID=3242487 RepID=UPI0035212EAA